MVPNLKSEGREMQGRCGMCNLSLNDSQAYFQNTVERPLTKE